MNMHPSFLTATLVGCAAMTMVTPTPSSAHGARHSKTGAEAAPGPVVTPIFERELQNLPGKSLLAVEVAYPPGGVSPPHRHPPSAFVYAYVVSGEVVSAIDDQPPRVYRAGESWSEAPGSRHRISRNASKTKPAKLLAVFVKNSGKGQLVFPDPK